ncbi:hypothetical protein J1N35_009486, partial [Gossypium stocksii]
FEAELQGILDGLALLQKRGLDKVLIQTDNLEVAKTIQHSQLANSNQPCL